jgi:hypothetical protein
MICRIVRLIAGIALMAGLAPMPAWAEFTLSDLVGNWSGSGKYYERPSSAKMKCRLSFAGDDARVRMTGRCGSSLGAQDLELDFIREGNRGVVVQSAPGAPKSKSAIARMAGQMTATMMIAEGVAATESAKFQLEIKPDGTMHFLTQRKDGTFFSQSTVVLVRR